MAGLPGTMQPYTLPAHTSPAAGRAGLGHPGTHENPSTRHDAALAMALQASMYEDSTTAQPGPARSTLLLPSLSWVGIVPDLRFTVGCFAAAFGGACKVGFRRVAVSHHMANGVHAVQVQARSPSLWLLLAAFDTLSPHQLSCPPTTGASAYSFACWGCCLR